MRMRVHPVRKGRHSINLHASRINTSKGEDDAMPPLSIMIKPVSSSCNMRCVYCFYADVVSHRAHENYGTMSHETVEDLVRKAFAYAEGNVSFSFQGGEPTLAGAAYFIDFIQTVEKYNQRGLLVQYAIQTNGYRLSEEMLSVFEQYHFLVGVSLDGCEQTHDRLRVDAQGHGTYERVIHTIQRLKKRRIPYNILCVVTHEVAQQIHAVWRSLAPHGYIQFIPCIDGLDGEKSSYSLTPEAYGEFLVTTFQLYEQGWNTGHYVSVRNFDNYMQILMGQTPEMCGMRGRCGLYFLIEADGSVYPCDFYVLDKWHMGNIRQQSFFQLCRSDSCREFQQAALAVDPACQACPWYYLCHGGCRRDRETALGNELVLNRFCKSYQYFFERCEESMQQLAARIKKGSPR